MRAMLILDVVVTSAAAFHFDTHECARKLRSAELESWRVFFFFLFFVFFF